MLPFRSKYSRFAGRILRAAAMTVFVFGRKSFFHSEDQLG